MEKSSIIEKGFLTVIVTWVGDKMGLLLPALVLLAMLMLLDFLSDILASKKEAMEHPGNKKYGWSSKKNTIEIYNKVGDLLTILVAVSADYLIFKFSKEIGIKVETNTIFGLLVSIWFIINELLSILENARRMGVTLPKFLVNALTDLKKMINQRSDSKK